MGNEKKWLRNVGWCLEVGYIRMQPTPHLISHPPVPPSLLLQPAFSPPHAPFLHSLGLPPSFLSVFLTGLHLLPFLCFLDQLLSLSLSLTLSHSLALALSLSLLSPLLSKRHSISGTLSLFSLSDAKELAGGLFERTDGHKAVEKRGNAAERRAGVEVKMV